MTGISDDHGWIHLHRKIQFNFLWTEPRTFSKAEAWIDMLMEARHSEKSAQILIGSHLIECGRGQCIKSLESWGNRWHWNKSKVRRFFALLQEANQIRLENVTKTTRITICNYGTYNGSRNESETIVKRSCNDDETRLTPNKNVRTGEGEKEKIKDALPEAKPARQIKLATDADWFDGVRLSYKALGVNADAELVKAKAWIEHDPKGKGRKLTQSFFIKWLNRADRTIQTHPQSAKPNHGSYAVT